MLYNDAFSIISLTMFEYFLADTYSPNILLMEENTVSLLYPSVPITNTILPFFKIFQLLLYNNFSWMRISYFVGRRILPYLDCGFNVIIKQVSEIFFTIICSVCNHSFYIVILSSSI